MMQEGQEPELNMNQTPASEENDSSKSGYGKRRRIDARYWKIGFVFFVVVVCILLLYFLFFKEHALFGFFHRLWSYVVPFLWGAVLAYLLKPICAVFENWFGKMFGRMKNRYRAEQIGKNLSVACTMLIFLALIYVLFAAIIPQVVASAKMLISNLPSYSEGFFVWLEGITEGGNLYDNVHDLHLDVQEMFSDTTESSLLNKASAWLYKYIESNYNNLINNITSSLSFVFSILKNLLIAVMSCVYILSMRKKLGAQSQLIIHSILPDRGSKKVMEEIHYIDRMFSGFINGKILDSIIIGILVFIVLTIFRIPYALLVSVIVGVTNIIPFFGPFIGAIPCAFLILIVSPIKCLTFIIIILVVQQLDGNVIGPKIIGENTGISSFWVLFSIAIFGGLWGFVGMIVGVPLFAVLYDLVRQFVQYGLKKRNKSDLYAAYEEEGEAIEQDKLTKKEAARERRKDRVHRFKKKVFRKRSAKSEDDL